MAVWSKAVWSGLMGICMMWLVMATTVAVPVESSADFQPSRNDRPSMLMIVPQLTNPAEIPVLETKPGTVSLSSWLDSAATTDISAATEISNEYSKRIELETIDMTVEQWLLSIKTFFADH
ncbi:MAG: hypothetical protein AAGF93_16740 [Cyanobacteria bacterium P01_H01_bin.105]